MRIIFLIPWHRTQYAQSGLTDLMAKWMEARPADECIMLSPSISSAPNPAKCIRSLPWLGNYFPFLRIFLVRQQIGSLKPDLLITEPGIRLPKSVNQLLWISQLLPTPISKQVLQQITTAKKIVFTSVLLLDQYKKQQCPLPDEVSIVPPVLAPVYEKQSLRTPSLYIKIVGSIPHEAALINLLKAYSLFKRRQQSELQLIFSQDITSRFPAFVKKLNSYKYRTTVMINPVQTPTQEADQEAGAYALLTLDAKDQLDFLYRKASQLQIPLLVLAEKEVDGATPVDQLAEQLMRIYKDEAYRKQVMVTQKSFFLLVDNQTAFNQFLAAAESY
ncbi:MAG: hypothetical protein KGO80_04705 [Bacteroidetes bacterium]|nr:hypothetical protein [Bacteroidota bacterium]